MMTSLDAPGMKAIRHWPIVLLRVYTGVFFVVHGYGKISGGTFSNGMVGFLNSQENMYGWYRSIVESVILPNSGLFAFLVSWGELAVGISMILGLATRYGAIAGAFMLANFWWAKGMSIMAGQNHDFMWVMIFIVLAGLHAGRTMSLDERLVGKYRFLA